MKLAGEGIPLQKAIKGKCPMEINNYRESHEKPAGADAALPVLKSCRRAAAAAAAELSVRNSAEPIHHPRTAGY